MWKLLEGFHLSSATIFCVRAAGHFWIDRRQRIRRAGRVEAAATANGVTSEHGMPSTGRRDKSR